MFGRTAGSRGGRGAGGRGPAGGRTAGAGVRHGGVSEPQLYGLANQFVFAELEKDGVWKVRSDAVAGLIVEGRY